MSSVFSIDSDGIWKACTTNVITNTAITMVVASDCSEFMPLESECFAWEAATCGGSGSVATSGSTCTSLMTA